MRTSLFRTHRLFYPPTQLYKRYASAPNTNNSITGHTIYALATPNGRAGIAVVRVSGDGVQNIYKKLVRFKGSSLQHSKMKCCKVIDSNDGSVIDNGMCVLFKGPKSFTSEDVLELHIHSSQATIARTLESLSRIPSCRPALPGEFTQRAFLGGRIDLTQAEALNDLIESVTEEQRSMALRVMEGETSRELERLRNEVLNCLAMIEALIDFGDGEAIEDDLFTAAQSRTSKLKSHVLDLIQHSRRAEIVRSGVKLVIFGPPNVGKSSLLNFLSQREVAIVTSVAGTTRDVLQLSMDLKGIPVVVSDTAGIRDSKEEVERLGIERALKAVEQADLRLCVLSLPELITTDNKMKYEMIEKFRYLLGCDTILLCNKLDLMNTTPRLEEALRQIMVETGCKACWSVSLADGTGLEQFVDDMSTILQARFKSDTDQTPVVLRARQRHHLENALSNLESVLRYGPEEVVLAAEELRQAAHSIGNITGRVSSDEILDEIFRGFCIGK